MPRTSRAQRRTTQNTGPSQAPIQLRAIPTSPQKISTVQILEPQPRPAQGWTPAKIKSAERQADNGDIALAADLGEYLQADDRVSGLVQTLGLVAALPLSFDTPGTPGTEETTPQAAALEEDFWKFLPEDTITQTIGWLRILGVAFLHVRSWDFDPESGRVLPTIEVWHPRNFKFDFGVRKWVLKGDKPQVIEPGDGRWIVITAFDRLRPWSRAPWRSLSRFWLLKNYAISDWGLYSNKNATGFLVAKNTTQVGSATPEARTELTRDLQQLGRNGAAALPDGFDLDLVESVARTFESFKLQIEMADLAASIALTGNNLTTQVDGGSHAAANVHERVTIGRIRSIAEALSTALRDQLLVWYTAWNFGVGAVAPYPHWDTRPPRSRKDEADTLSSAATALQQLMAAGAPVDTVAFCEAFGIPVDPELAASQAKGQVFQYHLNFGVLTLNEIRERLGLPPIEGGDEPPAPIVADGGDPSGFAADRSLQLRRFTADDQFAENLADSATDAGAASLAPHVDELLDIIEKADSPHQLKSLLLETYAELDVERYAEVIERASVLAHLRGRRAAIREV